MEHHELLHYLNSFEPERFPALTSRHISRGFWWLAIDENNVAAGFTGMVPFFDQADGVGYLKRAYVLPQYRGQGMQIRFIAERESKASELGWHLLVTECARDNIASARNLLHAGFEAFTPDQKWAGEDSMYFRKRI